MSEPFENEGLAHEDPAFLPIWRKEISPRMRPMVGDSKRRAKLFASVSDPSFQSYVREAVRVGSLADLHDSWAQKDRRRNGDPRIVHMLEGESAAEFQRTLKSATKWNLSSPVTTSLTPKSRLLLEPLLQRARAIWQEDAAPLRHDLGFIFGGGIELDYLPKRARIARPRHFVGTPRPWNSAIGRAAGAKELLHLNLAPFGLEVSLDHGSLD